MTKSKFFFILIILISIAVFSCGSKDQKQEYIDDKPVTNQNINSGNNTTEQKKTEIKPDSLNPKTSQTDNSKDKDYKPFTKTYNPVAIVSPLEAGDYMGKDITVKGFVADIYQSEKVAYLNFVQKFPDNPFTAVIFASRFSSFPDIKKYEKKNVEVTGRVSQFKGKPQVILDGESQIKITN